MLYPTSLSLAVQDGDWDQGLAGLLCQNLSALLFLHWEQCKGFQAEIWLRFLLGELVRRVPVWSVPLGRPACPVNPLGVTGTDPGTPNSTWLFFHSQSSTLGEALPAAMSEWSTWDFF